MQVVLIGTVVGAGGRPPSMYVLGSSIMDVGNNNYLPGPAADRANHLPGLHPHRKVQQRLQHRRLRRSVFRFRFLFICINMHMDSI
jgi:hypothetical protein